VLSRFGTPRAELLPRLDLDELADMSFPAGSMGPKVDACHRFVAATGRTAAIGALADATAVLAGANGTTITTTKQASA
jgi:carbamate kinase